MFLILRPSRIVIDSFVDRAAESQLTYPNVGPTDGVPPDGYVVDHNRIELSRDWEAAKQAIREWKMFDFHWVDICWPDVPIETGRNVAILIRHFGAYSLNATRIVYTIEEADRFGFACSTTTVNPAKSGLWSNATPTAMSGTTSRRSLSQITHSPRSGIHSSECCRNSSHRIRNKPCFALFGTIG